MQSQKEALRIAGVAKMGGGSQQVPTAAEGAASGSSKGRVGRYTATLGQVSLPVTLRAFGGYCRLNMWEKKTAVRKLSAGSRAEMGKGTSSKNMNDSVPTGYGTREDAEKRKSSPPGLHQAKTNKPFK